MNPILYSAHPLARNANEEHKENLSKIESICSSIVKGISSPLTLILATIIQILWIAIGQLTHIDPYPFAFLLTCSNVIQLILIFIIAVGQSLDAGLAESRADADHQSISNILHHQDIQEEMILAIMNHLQIDAKNNLNKITALNQHNYVDSE